MGLYSPAGRDDRDGRRGALIALLELEAMAQGASWRRGAADLTNHRGREATAQRESSQNRGKRRPRDEQHGGDAAVAREGGEGRGRKL